MRVLQLLLVVLIPSPGLGLPHAPSVEGPPRDNLSAESGCYFDTYVANDCKGVTQGTYEFSPTPHTCRSCEEVHGAHSFKLWNNCPKGFYAVRDGGCHASWVQMDAIPTNGHGCYNVNTGDKWASGTMCFYG
ncbi:hypothetical protein F4778DRAFT_776446 [Xylariomycetidae sp. FL2044]|nr:hypothetical protein F4778DRAFT_776446 [Xylariomycetidae sp. FL2044]